MDLLLGLSTEFAYFKGRGPVKNRELPHDPWFWAIPEKGEDAAGARRRIEAAWQKEGGARPAGQAEHPLHKIKALGELTTIKSFVRFGETRPAFPVYAVRSFDVPEISDELFGRHHVFTAEHDVPYQQRVCVDLAAGVYHVADGRSPGHAWPFDTAGEKQKLRILVYDIETTQYAAGAKKAPPIDMLGWAEFEVAYRASKDLEKEEFQFELVDDAPDWRSVEVRQDEAADADAEVKLLLQFARRLPNYDIVSGHNILSFDNKEVYDRIETLIEGNGRAQTLSANERRAFEEFMRSWAAKDRTFTFGQQAETVNFHPTSLDTYHAARRFYFFLDDFTLKRLAPFMGVEIPNRVYLGPNELRLGDPQTRLYNRHDVMEQVGVTATLLAQALPLAFSTGWTFEELLTGGNVRMWDHMGMIRAARARKIMPATCRAQGVARAVIGELGTEAAKTTKSAIWTHARGRIREPDAAQRLKEFLRVAKYGEEMPDFVELPTVIVNPKAVEAQMNPDQAAEDDEEEEYLGYSIPGGLTLHPQALGSHFVPWWHVVTADVGAMYPTILRALNVSADTIRLARAGETPDDWVWMYRLPDDFTKDPRWVVRAPGPEESYATTTNGSTGVMIGIKKNPDPGVTTLAMKGVMGIAARVKRLLGQARKEGKAPKSEIDRLAMMYASLKANRNAGTHGQMLAVNVSCRGFNLWAGGEITTIGQKILVDARKILEDRGSRIVYADTDGLYIGCSKSGKNFPEISEALGVEYAPGSPESWYIFPDDAVEGIKDANDQIRRFLNYEAFELEAEHHDAMVFVVHKNYLIFDVKKGRLEMFTKGNNFRGSDKAPIAQRLLGDIMRSALRDVVEWTDEEQAREALKAAIKKWTREVLKGFDVTKVDKADLTLVQVVQPAVSYKPNPDGSDSMWIKRAKALEQVTKERLRASKKYRFVVCKQPLPGIEKPSKAGMKPLDYMWPIDHIKGDGDIDLGWYKDMIEKYVRGAFGFEDLELHTQRGLDAWM
jgi:DNA polymerase elongation subunit (family B)